MKKRAAKTSKASTKSNKRGKGSPKDLALPKRTAELTKGGMPLTPWNPAR